MKITFVMGKHRFVLCRNMRHEGMMGVKSLSHRVYKHSLFFCFNLVGSGGHDDDTSLGMYSPRELS